MQNRNQNVYPFRLLAIPKAWIDQRELDIELQTRINIVFHISIRFEQFSTWSWSILIFFAISEPTNGRCCLIYDLMTPSNIWNKYKYFSFLSSTFASYRLHLFFCCCFFCFLGGFSFFLWSQNWLFCSFFLFSKICVLRSICILSHFKSVIPKIYFDHFGWL